MKLGLVRHFKVITDEKYLLNSDEFARAMQNYDKAPVDNNGLIIRSEDWDVCYCSTLPRAVVTAESIFSGKIIKTDLLIEVPISPFTRKNIKMPSFIWHIASRIAWYKSHKSQTENIHETKKRIHDFFTVLKNSGYKNILIVSHGYFLRMFYEELKKEGFAGFVDVNIQNGKLYIIENYNSTL
jgi:broad specificity phosphatase PhoE